MNKSIDRIRIETQVENVSARSQRAIDPSAYLHDMRRLQNLQELLNALITGEEQAIERMRGRH